MRVKTMSQSKRKYLTLPVIAAIFLSCSLTNSSSTRATPIIPNWSQSYEQQVASQFFALDDYGKFIVSCAATLTIVSDQWRPDNVDNADYFLHRAKWFANASIDLFGSTAEIYKLMLWGKTLAENTGDLTQNEINEWTITCIDAYDESISIFQQYSP